MMPTELPGDARMDGFYDGLLDEDEDQEEWMNMNES